MLDNVFKNSRKFLGVPLAILLVTVIALATGGTALGAYWLRSVTVQTTVMEPLTYSYDGNWTPEPDRVWVLGIYACETKTAWVTIINDADVEVPISAAAIPDVDLPGVTCSVLQDGTLPLTVVPRHYAISVAVTVSVACDAPIPGGIESQRWTVNFSRG